MNTSISTSSTGIRVVKSKGNLIDTQEVANILGRNWQFVNKLRSAGRFVDPSAKLGNTFLYAKSVVQRWARQNMTGVGGKVKTAA